MLSFMLNVKNYKYLHTHTMFVYSVVSDEIFSFSLQNIQFDDDDDDGLILINIYLKHPIQTYIHTYKLWPDGLIKMRIFIYI